MTGLEEVLKRAANDLDAVGARWAIIGGLAVATRAAPRFTQDVDFAVSVADDAEAWLDSIAAPVTATANAPAPATATATARQRR